MQPATSPNERLVFDFTMESLVKVLGTLTPGQENSLRAIGVDVRKLAPAYPNDVYVAVIDYVASQRWPTMPRDQATYELGRVFVDGYAQTFMGKALKSVVRVIGPHRFLERLRRTFRSGNNFAETRMTQLGPTAYELWFNCVYRPHYYRGILFAGLEVAGVKEPQVELVRYENAEPTFHVRWTE